MPGGGLFFLRSLQIEKFPFSGSQQFIHPEAMHEYDTALKNLLRCGTQSLLALASVEVDRWHNVELPEVRNRGVDLLDETTGGGLIHIELQSTHDANMSLRMMEYFAVVWRQFGRFPEQVVLYVGEQPLRMAGVLNGPNFSFTCRIADIREFDGEKLLASPQLEDTIMSILAKVKDHRAGVRRILSSIVSGKLENRSSAVSTFLILAGLRKLEALIEQEASQMPLLDDIMDHAVLGHEFKRGLAQGREQGVQQGREQGVEQGRHDGELFLLLRLAEKRFGKIPAPLKDRLTNLPVAELESATLRLLDARSAEDIFG